MCSTAILVFFHKEGQEAVTHVGLALHAGSGKWAVLHASGEVRIDALTPSGIDRNGVLDPSLDRRNRLGLQRWMTIRSTPSSDRKR